MLILTAAFLADLWIGDPPYPWHPVRLMGKAIEWGEFLLRRLVSNPYWAGALLALGIPALVFLGVQGILLILGAIHPVLGGLAALFGVYSSISVRDLYQEAQKIYGHLKAGDLEAARRNLARIVGRETAHLDEAEITRACVESVAENSVDGIVAPLFFAAIGGAPLALAYKAVNTLDSMIGHKTERYREFGFWAARQDHWVNWIPARLAYLLIWLACFFTGLRDEAAFRTGKPYALMPAIGNSPIPEAAFAGALSVRLGGENLYHGKTVRAPFVGEPVRPLQKEVIDDSLRLLMAESWLTLGMSLILSLAR